MNASDRLMSMTAAHTTEAQDRALDAAWLKLETQGAANAFPDTPDARYDSVAAIIDTIPGYEALADLIAAAHGKVPADGGLDNDPLTQTLHDVWSEAQADAEDEQGREWDEQEAAMAEAEASARWHAMVDADLDARDRGW